MNHADYELHVPVETLRAAASVLLRHLEEVEGADVRIPEDYFWSVPAPEVYDPYLQPDALTMGSLSDSMENIESMVSNPDDALSYGLVWLADILRAVGLQVVR